MFLDDVNYILRYYSRPLSSRNSTKEYIDIIVGDYSNAFNNWFCCAPKDNWGGWPDTLLEQFEDTGRWFKWMI